MVNVRHIQWPSIGLRSYTYRPPVNVGLGVGIRVEVKQSSNPFSWHRDGHIKFTFIPKLT